MFYVFSVNNVSIPQHITFICTWCTANHPQERQTQPKSHIYTHAHTHTHTHTLLTLAHSPGLRTAVIACGRDCRWIDSFSSTDTIIHEATTHSNTTLLQYLSLSLLGAEINLCTVRPVLLRPRAYGGRTPPNETRQPVDPLFCMHTHTQTNRPGTYEKVMMLGLFRCSLQECV